MSVIYQLQSYLMLEFEELIRWRVIPQVVDEAVALPEGDDETVDGTWTPEQIMIIMMIQKIVIRISS